MTLTYRIATDSRWLFDTPAVLVIVDSRLTAAGYAHTVAPLAFIGDEVAPVLDEAFEVYDGDIERAG